jgi:hypothetical protein
MRIERGERYLCVYTSYDMILNEVFYTHDARIYFVYCNRKLSYIKNSLIYYKLIKILFTHNVIFTLIYII